MLFEILIPSKTFLVGEYISLRGGPSLILCTTPCFKLIVNQNLDNVANFYSGIHTDSPAGKLISRHLSFYQHYQLTFVDPYHGLGGLGASSAQFAALFALKQNFILDDATLFEALSLYRQVAWNGKGIAPSGADVIAQMKGGMCFFHADQKRIELLKWPFTDASFCLIHTGNKLATHQHLADLHDFDTTDMTDVVYTAYNSIINKDSWNFAITINKFAKILEKQNLVLAETKKLINEIRQQEGVLACKGCGALGADIIFVLLETKIQYRFLQWAKQFALPIINMGHEVSAGLNKIVIKN